MVNKQTRAAQKEKTRRAIIDAAFHLLDAETSFSNLSLREVAREAGIAPTSFYRHFSSMEELGLTLVDEGGLTLRQLMRQARQRIESGGSIISTSVETFMEFINSNSNVFRVLLRERSGTSKAFRAAVAREIRHFVEELSAYIEHEQKASKEEAMTQAEALVTLVFNAGAEALDMDNKSRKLLNTRLKAQLRYVAKGASVYQKFSKQP